MKASTSILRPGDVVQCARPTDPDQYRVDELVGTIVWVEHRGWLDGSDCEGKRLAWREEYGGALHQRRVKIACRREDGELTDESLPFVAIIAYRTIVWAPKETQGERAERQGALADYRRAKAAYVRGGTSGPGPTRPKLHAKWKPEPFSADPTLGRWYFATLPGGTYIRASKGPYHDAMRRREKRDNERLTQRKERWRELCKRWPALCEPLFRNPPRRHFWQLHPLGHDEQVPLSLA